MVKKQQKNSGGCLWLIVTCIFTFVGFAFFSGFLGISASSAIAIAVVGSIILTSMILGMPSKKALILNGFLLFILFIGSKFLLQFLLRSVEEAQLKTPTFSKDESVKETFRIEDRDTIAVYSSHRIWRDNYGNSYHGDLTVREKDFTELKKLTSTYNATTTKNFWGNLYHYLEKESAPSLDLLVATFRQIEQEHQLTQMEFAEMVVTCIQDIPYSFVFQEECLEADVYEDSIKYILQKCPDCCIGNILYGIQNPVSFMQNLKGDCDTRTVLIYSILKHFGYDVAILNSDFYRHSIIGLHLPAAGQHKIYKGKKYMLWETTAQFYEIGKLPSNFNNVTHWNVVLSSH